MTVVILTGAGISQESGLPTFRGSDGLWEGYRVEEVATPQAFHANPDLVHEFYNLRRRALLNPEVKPNAAHLALARLEDALPDDEFWIITQNIDDLHRRAGSRNVLHMHGELLKARCLDTGEVFDWRDDLSTATVHPRHPHDRTRRGRLRPNIVWFGETPMHVDQIESVVSKCSMFAAIGTSGNVYPAAGLVQWTPPHCHRIEINLDDTPVASAFAERVRGSASNEVPKWVDRISARRDGPVV